MERKDDLPGYGRGFWNAVQHLRLDDGDFDALASNHVLGRGITMLHRFECSGADSIWHVV
jgi:hypothetical protein